MRQLPTSRPHIPIGLIATAAALALAIVGGILAWLTWMWPAGMFYLFYGGLLMTAGAGIARAYVGVVVYMRRNDHKYIQADKVIEHTRATVQVAPLASSFHFAPRSETTTAPQPALPELVSAPQLPPGIPSFGELLDSGKIGPGKQLILGYSADSGEAITGDWKSLYSCGVGGMTGSGKSWSVAFLAGQSAAAGARIILVDPHAGDSESLASRLAPLAPSFMCDVASSGKDIEAALKLASSKLDNRKAGRGGNWPILLICDEWTSMLRGRMGELLTAVALDYSEQGRKFGCFAILAAQAWQVDAAGEVRDRLASHFVLRTRPDQFRYQTGMRAGTLPEDTLTLQPGQAYFLTTRGDLSKVVIPQMTPADIGRLGAMIDRPAATAGSPFGFTRPPTGSLPAITARKPDGSQMEAKTVLASTATGSQKVASPEAAHAAGLFLAGKSPQEIAFEMRGVKSSDGGRKYQTAIAEVYDLIREGMQS